MLTLSRARAGGAVAGLLLLMYLLQTVSKLLEGGSFLSRLSLFAYLSPADVIDRGVVPVGDVAVLGTISIACWAGAIVAFKRRDLIA